MKKLILIIAVVAIMLPSCKKINEALDSLDGRLDKLEQEAIPSIDEQIAAINTTLENLDSMDKELKGYIDALTTTASNLQEQINTTNTKIDEVEAALKKELEDSNAENLAQLQTAKAEVLAQLEAAKTELENELAQINATIATLQEKDKELDEKIKDLNDYVNNELTKTTTWVEATFATLEQYNSLVTEIAVIKEQIKATNQSIAALETYLTTKINADIAAAVASLNADIQQKVKEITDAYTDAIKSAKEEITAAYTTAIQTAITTLDNSLKTWVGEQLANYYTIAQIDAMLATMEQEMNGKLEAQKAYLEGLINELSAALTKSIADNKVLIEGLQKDITTLQGTAAEHASRIAQNASTIATNTQNIIDLSKSIYANKGDISANEKAIADNKALIEANAKLIADNKNAIEALKNSTSTSITANATAIAKNAEDIAQNGALISANAVAINNNAAAIADNAADILQLQQHFANMENEITEICQKIVQDAINNNGTITSSEALALSNRIDNEISTFNYQIAIIATRVSVLENEILTIKQQIAEILSDITDMKEDISALLARIQSISYIPTYEDGKATVKNDDGVSSVTLDFEISPKDAVAELAKVWQSAVSVKAIYTQTRAVSFIDMPIISFEADATNGVISVTASGENLSDYFFNGAQSASARLSISDGNNSISSNYIPLEIQSVIEYTTYNNDIVIPTATPEYEIVSNTYENGVGRMVFAGRLTTVTALLFRGCSSLNSITIPISVKSIENGAFQNCSRLHTVNMLSLTPPVLGSSVFSSTASDLVIYVPYPSIEIYKTRWSTYKSKIYDPTIANNTIFYTTSDGEILTNYNAPYGVNIISNTYENGLGIITFDSDVTIIGYLAFENCTTLTSLIIPNSVITIEGAAFDGCDNLSKVVIGNRIKEIYSLQQCSALTELYCNASEPPTLGNIYDEADESLMCKWDLNKIKIYIPSSSINSYKMHDDWRYFAEQIIGI